MSFIHLARLVCEIFLYLFVSTILSFIFITNISLALHFSKTDIFTVFRYITNIIIIVVGATMWPQWFSPYISLFFLLHTTGSPSQQHSPSGFVSVVMLNFCVTCKVRPAKIPWTDVGSNHGRLTGYLQVRPPKFLAWIGYRIKPRPADWQSIS